MNKIKIFSSVNHKIKTIYKKEIENVVQYIKNNIFIEAI